MSTFATSDPCTNLLLDFIAGGVPTNPNGESTGNYNAVIGDAHASDDLSQKSLTEIYQLQSQLLSHGRPSTAVGRYQIIRLTLQTAAGKARLDPDTTMFTPELQDHLAVSLLVTRGYSLWWRDKIDDEQFLHNLSCEWASLPDPWNDGRSHYDGIGPNHAGVSLDACYDMLVEARTLRKSA